MGARPPSWRHDWSCRRADNPGPGGHPRVDAATGPDEGRIADGNGRQRLPSRPHGDMVRGPTDSHPTGTARSAGTEVRRILRTGRAVHRIRTSRLRSPRKTSRMRRRCWQQSLCPPSEVSGRSETPCRARCFQSRSPRCTYERLTTHQSFRRLSMRSRRCRVPEWHRDRGIFLCRSPLSCLRW